MLHVVSTLPLWARHQRKIHSLMFLGLGLPTDHENQPHKYYLCILMEIFTDKQIILPLSWEGSLYNQAFHSIFTVFTSSTSVDLSLGSVHARSLYTVVQSIFQKLNQANNRKQNFTSCYIHTWSKSQMNCNTNGVIRKQKVVTPALKSGEVSDILIVTGEKEMRKGASLTPKQI